jgi:Nucleotidyltransferase
MKVPGAPDDEYVAARRVLLDALEALDAHRNSIVVVGAQAVYVHTGAADLVVAEFTTDADLAVDPAALRADPRLDAALADKGFVRHAAQPGIYWSPDGIEVDLMVPETLGGAGRRGARLRPHGNRAARKARGLEAALVDHRSVALEALAPDDGRSIEVRIAGVAALLVAKAHKLGERMRRAPQRMLPKDALDTLRLLRAAEPDELAHSLRQLLADPRAGEVTREGLDYTRALFVDGDTPGLTLVGEAVVGLDDPATVRASLRTLADQLLTRI